MTVKVDVGGLADFKEYLKCMVDGFDLFLRRFLLKEALRVLASTKRLTPVDTGFLRNSWFIGGSGDLLRGVKGQRVEIRRHKQGESQKKKYRTKYVKRYTLNSKQNGGVTINCVRREGDSLVVEIYNPVEYASHVEYGHVTSNRKGWVPGRYMCILSIKKIESQMPKHFDREFKTWLQSLNGKAWE